MLQKFNSDTLMGRFIKNLLAHERIPLLDCVTDGDIIIEDCLYIYRDVIIKCYKTGKLYVDKLEDLFPDDNLHPSLILFPGSSEHVALFKVIHFFNEHEMQQFSYQHNSPYHWYDAETHRHLGNYLRYLRDYKQLDLMPFYNCFTASQITDVHLVPFSTTLIHPHSNLAPSRGIYPGMTRRYVNSHDFVLSTNSDYTVYAIPIHFGKPYTVAVDCPYELRLRSVIYGPQGMLKTSPPDIQYEYYSDMLFDSSVTRPSSKYKEPFLYRVDTTNKLLYSKQRYLHLLIQLPRDCKSTITVLEGDYTKTNTVRTTPLSVKIDTTYKNLSLLRYNSHESYAFSNRLVEYLLWNVITHQEELTTNIEKTQKALCKLDSTYKELFDSKHEQSGVWSDYMKRSVLRIVERYGKTQYLEDQDGYINKEIERLFMQEGVRI